MSRDDWIVRERDLLGAYDSHAVGIERRRVKILWWTVAAGSRRVDVMGAVSQLWRGRTSDTDPVFVALYDAADAVGTPPFLVIRAAPGGLTGSRGRAVATVVGQAEPDGALVVETRHGPVVPVEPPSSPGDGAPPWSEVDTGA